MLRPNYDYVSASVAAVMDIHLEQPAGDVLVFLTGGLNRTITKLTFCAGQDDIERAVVDFQMRIQQIYDDAPEMFRQLAQPDVLALPLYAALPPEQQVTNRCCSARSIVLNPI